MINDGIIYLYMGLLGIIWDYMGLCMGLCMGLYGIMYGIIDAGWWLTYTSEKSWSFSNSWDDENPNFLWNV